jgi:hypothetical protein
MWSTHEVGGKPVEIFEAETPRPRFGLVFLPDPDDSVIRQWIAEPSRLSRLGLGCMIPQVPSWWSSRIETGFDSQRSAERWLVEELLPFAIGRWRLSANAIALSGIGAGGQGALRLAFKYPDRFPIVAAVEAAVDHYERYGLGTSLDEMYPSREHCRQDTALLHIHPARQSAHIWFGVEPDSRWFRGNDRLHEKLAALGVSHQFEMEASTKSLADKMLEFLVDGLNKESRRLL